jgi:hypothetical protein
MTNKLNRNDPCHCGSGKKYKNCCREKDNSPMSSRVRMAGIVIAILLGLWFTGIALSGGEGSQNCPEGTVWSESHQHCH